MEWRSKDSPRPKKPRMSKSKVKIMLFCFFDIRGIIYFEFVSEGTTVNQTFYLEVLKRLIDTVRRKRGELWRDRSFDYLPRHAPENSSLRVSQFLAEKYISAINYPLYSPDLAPADFWLFLTLKECAGRKAFSGLENIKPSVNKILTDVLFHDFKNGFEQWPKPWEHCK
jgi:hypothetical protein